MFDILFPVLAPVLISVLVGVVWAKMDLPFNTDMVSRLALYVGTPALVLSSFSHASIGPDLFFQMGVACIVQVALVAVISFFFIKLFRSDLRIYLSAMMFPNVGNMGLPLTLFAFGKDGLVLALAYFMVISMAHFSIGQSIISGNWGWRAFFKNPILIAIISALTMSFTGAVLPAWLVNTADLLGGFTIPLMLITLGFSLASLSVGRLGLAVKFAVLRVFVGLTAGFASVYLLALDGAVKNVVLLLSAMPVAVFNYLFSVRYNRSPEDIAGLVICSTLLSVLFLPILLSFLIGLK